MFSSTGYPTQFHSAEKIPDTFILFLERKCADMASASEWTDVCNISLFDNLWFHETSLFYFNALNWCWYLGKISTLHRSMMWPPDLVKCIKYFVEFHILYSFPQNPQYQSSLFPFSTLLSTLSLSQIERITSLLWWSSSWVRLYMIVISPLLNFIAPGTQEECSVSRINLGRNIWLWYTQQ